MQSDSELILDTLTGKREAFGELVRRYERGVRAVVVQIIHDTHLGKDVA